MLKQADVTESCIQLQNTEGSSGDKEATSPGLEDRGPAGFCTRSWLTGFERHFSDDCLSHGNAAFRQAGGRGAEGFVPPTPPTFMLHVSWPKEQRAESVVHKTKAS